MKIAEKITVLITEDHALIRESWSKILNASGHFEVVAECCNAEDAIEMSKALRPMVIMMDINLPGMSGIEATKKIREDIPDSKILGVSLHAQSAYAIKIMRAGATGYITKNCSVDEMFQALMDVADKKKYICREILEGISENFINPENPDNLLKTLSQREIDVVLLIRNGCSSKEIAESLSMSIRTVEAHRYNIFRKLKIKKAVTLINLVNKYPAFA
ncbi:MAG: response regulator transcription factor [Bacteroidota bacterium]